MEDMRRADALAKGGKPYQKATGGKRPPVEPTLGSLGIDKDLAKEMRRVGAMDAAEF